MPSHRPGLPCRWWFVAHKRVSMSVRHLSTLLVALTFTGLLLRFLWFVALQEEYGRFMFGLTIAVCATWGTELDGRHLPNGPVPRPLGRFRRTPNPWRPPHRPGASSSGRHVPGAATLPYLPVTGGVDVPLPWLSTAITCVLLLLRRYK